MWEHDELIVACPQCKDAVTEITPAQPLPSLAPVSRTPKKSPKNRTAGSVIAPYLYLFTTVVFAGALALDPFGRWFVIPLVGLLVLLAGFFVVAIVQRLPELVALFSDRRTRVTHGLEHACIGILDERGHKTFGGITKKGEFLLGVNYTTSSNDVRAAAHEAIRRFAAGDTQLAYTPRCGTSSTVGALLFSFTILGCTIAAVGFGVGTGPAFMAAAVLGCLAMLLQKPLGLLAQKKLTVSARFSSATVGELRRADYGDGETGFAVPITVTL